MWLEPHNYIILFGLLVTALVKKAKTPLFPFYLHLTVLLLTQGQQKQKMKKWLEKERKRKEKKCKTTQQYL